MSFRALEPAEKAAVANLQAKGKANGRLDPDQMAVAFDRQGKRGCVTIAMVKPVADEEAVYPGWAKYRLSDEKQENHHQNSLFGHMKSFSRAVQRIPIEPQEERPQLSLAAAAGGGQFTSDVDTQ